MQKSVVAGAVCSVWIFGCGGGAPPSSAPPPSLCTPTTCAAAEKNCGAIPDGCGGTLQCGSCPSGQTCGGGGAANVCGGGACVPATCAAAGATCGQISDGCGGTLQCGTCSPGQTCGAAAANVCGAVQPPAGPTAWVDTFSGAPVTALGTDGASRAAIALGGQGGNAVAEVDGTGQVLWTQPDRNDFFFATVSPATGELLFSGSTPSSSGPGAALLERFSADGASRSSVATGTDVSQFGPLASGAPGDVAWVAQVPSHSDLVVLHPDGARLDVAQSAALPVAFVAVALGDGGELAAVGQVKQPFAAAGQTVGIGPAMLKLDRSGNLLWARPVPLEGTFYAVGTTHLGTVVGLGQFSGSAAWGGRTLSSSSPTWAVFVAESDGQPRLFIELPAADASFRWSLAVDPAGQLVAAAVLPSCAGLGVRRYDLAGDLLWTRSFVSSACGIQPAGIDMLGSSAVLGGSFSGTVDFGKGPVQAGTTDGFLIELGP